MQKQQQQQHRRLNPSSAAFGFQDAPSIDRIEKVKMATKKKLKWNAFLLSLSHSGAPSVSERSRMNAT